MAVWQAAVRLERAVMARFMQGSLQIICGGGEGPDAMVGAQKESGSESELDSEASVGAAAVGEIREMAAAARSRARMCIRYVIFGAVRDT